MHKAYIDGYEMPYNPNSVSWSYSLNMSSTDTLGGRVVQLLSTNINAGTWEGEAGTRTKLIDLYDKIEEIMSKHVQTKLPVRLEVPSRNWSMDVYIRAFPSLTWNLQTTAYRYQLSFEVDQDLGGLTKTVLSSELSRLASQIGYDRRYSGNPVFRESNLNSDGTPGTGGDFSLDSLQSWLRDNYNVNGTSTTGGL